jgi:hypothetical protein
MWVIVYFTHMRRSQHIFRDTYYSMLINNNFKTSFLPLTFTRFVSYSSHYICMIDFEYTWFFFIRVFHLSNRRIQKSFKIWISYYQNFFPEIKSKSACENRKWHIVMFNNSQSWWDLKVIKIHCVDCHIFDIFREIYWLPILNKKNIFDERRNVILDHPDTEVPPSCSHVSSSDWSLSQDWAWPNITRIVSKSDCSTRSSGLSPSSVNIVLSAPLSSKNLELWYDKWIIFILQLKLRLFHYILTF